MARKIAVIGEKKKTFGIVIEPPHRNHAGQLLGQRFEDCWSALRVLMRRNASLRLVISPETWRLSQGQGPSIHEHLVLRQHVKRRTLDDGSIDGHTPFLDQSFRIPPGAKPRSRNDLCDSFPSNFPVLRYFVKSSHDLDQ